MTKQNNDSGNSRKASSSTGGMAQLIHPRATWSDLVLSPAQMTGLREITALATGNATANQDRQAHKPLKRSPGMGILFAGQDGKGKALAAEVIAGGLGLLLYRIDLAAVVSKYIGETEKNLRRLFDAAEAGGAVLFFDEADALFGRRSEVKDSHDRYANIEINYLLQRIESYRGLAILASNARSNIDAPFLRRFRFIVEFPARRPSPR